MDVLGIVLTVLLLAFLFVGEPNAYSVLHAYAMHLEACR